ncbi:sugar-binding transcriptional regulator [Phosphitispora sp. TUW77]|uniref:sugar-binding transcriptional regulator n=1 Tax=Phosphitispora sp. TUW77 TaxID=3152361 RepID=UPI003AB39C82
MKDIITLQQKIVPELIELIERRYTILRHVSHSQPVGRRVLAHDLRLGERIVRSELDFLKGQGLLEGDLSGVKLTGDGELMIHELSDFIKDLRGLVDIENSLRERLGLKQAIVVPGDSDSDESVKKELGRVASRHLLGVLKEGSIIAVTGGTTVGEVANAVPISYNPRDLLLVPARGGLGEEVEIQANTIAAKIAKRLKAQYRLLHVPDNIGEDAMNSLNRDPHIKDIIKTIKSADILVHGIGNAREISANRDDSPEKTKWLIDSGSVGEAFGHYFAKNGTIIWTIHSLGIRLNDLKKIDHVIGVAGGRKKAAAILAVCSSGSETVLVTDEGAGRAMLEQLNEVEIN